VYTPKLDPDGLPYAGQVIKNGDPLCCIVNSTTLQARYEKHKEGEDAYVDQVTVCGDEGAAGAAAKAGGKRKGGEKKTRGPARINIKLRFNRNPIVGDKFSSRHGQKGVMSVLW
jgi:DNA-directed RNA polymerase I subunit RPA2